MLIAGAEDVSAAITKERANFYMKSGRILGAFIMGGLVISAMAQDGHQQAPASGSVTATAPAATSNIAETPGTDPQVPLPPRDLLKEYEKQMVVVSLKACEELAQIARAAHEGQIGPEQAAYLSGQRLELGMIRLQFLDSLHQILDDKIQKEAKQESEVRSSGETLVLPPPDSSPDVSRAIAKDLELTPVQIAAIQAQIEKERGRVRPLTERLATNRRALIAATLKGQFDGRQVRDLAAQQSRIQESLIVANARLQTDVYKILTADQQRKLDGMRKETAGLTHPSFTEW
jgi:Spy/CpxP family protein refolding chaperone